MVWARRVWLQLQTLFRRGQNAPRLNDEMQFHLEQQIAENICAGMSREEARYAAQQTFGNSTALREETRETWGGYGLNKPVRTCTIRSARCGKVLASPQLQFLTLRRKSARTLRSFSCSMPCGFAACRSRLRSPWPWCRPRLAKEPERLRTNTSTSKSGTGAQGW